MKAREFFRKVRVAESELKILNAKLDHYRDIGLSMGGAPGGAIGSGQRGASRVEMAAIGTVDLYRDILDQERELRAIIARAEQVIRDIPQERYRQILTYRYLCGWSFKSITDELRYNDPNSVYRAHGWALHEAQLVINRLQGGEQDGSILCEVGKRCDKGS